jgi:hypothetical protein
LYSSTGFGSGIQSLIYIEIARNNIGQEFDHLLRHLRISIIFGWLFAPIYSMIINSISIQINLPKCANPGIFCCILFTAYSIISVIGWLDMGKILRYCRLRQSLTLAYERVSVSSRKSYGTISALDLDSPRVDSNESEEYARILRLGSTKCQTYPFTEQTHQPHTTESNQPLLHKSSTQLTISDEMLETAEEMMGDMHTTNWQVSNGMMSPEGPSTPTPGVALVSELYYNGSSSKKGTALAI